MIEQLVASAVLGVIFLYGLLEMKASPVVGLGIAATAAVGVVLALLTDLEALLARGLGLPAGQLVLGVAIALGLLIMLNLHLKNRRTMRTITALTREIAIGAGRAAETTGRRVHAPTSAPVPTVRSRRAVARLDTSRALARMRSVTPVHPEE